MTFLALILAVLGWQTSWLGVTLGEPLSAVYDRMGDPIVATADDKVTTFVYSVDKGRSFVTVLAQHGIVSGVRLWEPPGAQSTLADPKGVMLGNDITALTTDMGTPSRNGQDSEGPYHAYQNGDVLWLYHMNGDATVRSITLATTEAAVAAIPAAPVPAVHAGDSIADAIRVVASSGADGVNWEHLYLAVHPCAKNGRWTMTKQVLQRLGGRSYDELTATCSGDEASRVFYFDATAYAGKL